MPLGDASDELTDYLAHLLIMRDWLAHLRQAMAFQAEVSPAATAFDAAVLDAAARIALIDRDIADLSLLGVTLAGTPQGSTPVLPAPAAWREPAYCWGVRYVIEGAQLGGALLSRRLGARHGATLPLRYLSGDGSAPGRRWQAFVDALCAAVRESAQIDTACAAACQAFDLLLAWAGRHRVSAPASAAGWAPGSAHPLPAALDPLPVPPDRGA